VCVCVCVLLLNVPFHFFFPPPQTEGLCSGDGVIIQTVSSDPASSDPLGQSQLIVEAEAGQDPEVGLDAAGLLVAVEGVSPEPQPMADGFADKVAATDWFLLSCI